MNKRFLSIQYQNIDDLKNYVNKKVSEGWTILEDIEKVDVFNNIYYRQKIAYPDNYDYKIKGPTGSSNNLPLFINTGCTGPFILEEDRVSGPTGSKN